MAHFVEQWEELTNDKWFLSIARNGFKFLLSVVPINLSQSSSPLLREEIADHQNNFFSNSGFGTNFPFSFGQTVNSSRQIAFTTSANVPNYQSGNLTFFL